MGTFPKKREFKDVLPAVILWGCFGGICLTTLFILLHEAWAPVILYNNSISRVKDILIIVSSAILFCTLGMAASDLFCTGRKKEHGPVFTGLLSGITTAFVFSSIYVILSSSYLFSWDNGIFEVNTSLKLTEWLILFTVFGITSGTFQAIGAWYRHSRKEAETGRTNVREKTTFSGILFTYRFFILILLALLIIPPVIATVGIETGDINRDNAFYRPFDFDRLNVSRTGDGSILFLLNPDPGCPQRGPGFRFVNITVDGRDVSTQSIITGSGLNLSIDPPEGLLYRDNSSAILRGDYLSGNDTVLLRVDVTYSDLGFEDVIFNGKI